MTKAEGASIKAGPPPGLLSFKGKVTQQITEEWSIRSFPFYKAAVLMQAHFFKSRPWAQNCDQYDGCQCN